jgi:hypothetical protein
VHGPRIILPKVDAFLLPLDRGGGVIKASILRGICGTP